MTEAKQNRVRLFAFVIVIFVSVCFTIYFAFSNFGQLHQSYKIELDSSLNPNDAPAASLARLPGIGVGRAAAIIDYRDNFSGTDGNSPAFQSCDDLQKVRGLGVKTTQNISEWLKFE